MKNTDILRSLARIGAISRLAELETEAEAIRSEFPELVGRKVTATRRRMTAAQRKAVSLRMKAYWAKRRKQA